MHWSPGIYARCAPGENKDGPGDLIAGAAVSQRSGTQLMPTTSCAIAANRVCAAETTR
jgi:hypothetical protein